MAGRALTREESKAITRKRLIEAALKLAGESDGRSLTVSRVAREAGVAQPTFYVHFRDRDHLLRAVGESRIEELRRELSRSRSRIDLDALARDSDGSGLRDVFRFSLDTIVSRPLMFRVYIRERTHTDSPLGRHCRRVADDLRADLVEDLRQLDRYLGRERSGRELEMLADGIMSYTETLGLGLLDGRYDDVESLLDTLTRFARAQLA